MSATIEPFRPRASAEPAAAEPAATPEPAVAPEAAKEPQKPTCDPPDLYDTVTPIFQRIQAIRKRKLFVLGSHGINGDTATEIGRWRNALREAGESDQLDVLIASYGGELNACYQIARLFARRARSWEALVPWMATSGATLISLGSSHIVMGEMGQLSPIDPQVISKRREKFFDAERQSPLEAFQAVKYLREFALTSLDAAMLFNLRHGVAPRPAIESATSLAYHLVQPILSKIEPYDLGAFDLDSKLALDYCSRVVNPADSSKKTQRNVDFTKLVEKYPAHEFLIDLEEAQALGFNASQASAELEDVFDELRSHLDDLHVYIGRVPETN